MKGNQILLLAFAVIAIGLFVLPNTMSMFVGQHYWKSVRTASTQYDLCKRCHFEEVSEWEANKGAHFAYRNYYSQPGRGGDPGCFCHQINETRLSNWFVDLSETRKYNYTFFNQSGDIDPNNASTWKAGWRNTTTPHAATTIECLDCHRNTSLQIQNPNEAHKAFFEQARNSSVGTNNTACMACHTMVGLNVTMERVKSGLTIYANHTAKYNETTKVYDYIWTVNVSINNTDRATKSNYSPPYNSSS